MKIMSLLVIGALLLGIALLVYAQEEEGAPLPPLGDMPIRFYSGQTGVQTFIDYWKGISHDSPDWCEVGQGQLDQILRNAQDDWCEYQCWVYAEPEEGQWRWHLYQNGARKIIDNGLGYVPFCWLHFPPNWYAESPVFVPYKNLETGETIPQLSLWSPDLEGVYDRYYSRLSKAQEGQIAYIRLAMPSEYGELGYCYGMTHWLRPQPTAKPGYWCGDDYALADFRKTQLARYGSLAALNTAWGTSFALADDVVPPQPLTVQPKLYDSVEARRYWVDFADWYNQAWTETLRKTTTIVQGHFPGKELIASLGYAQEPLKAGNDEGRHIAEMAKLGISAQTPGDVGYFPTRRVSTACKFYDVPYYTEPPSDVPRDRQLNRLHMDLVNGVETWFDYLGNMDRARDYFETYRELFTGKAAITPVAIWHPTLEHWLHPDQPWSAATAALSDPLRDCLVYEVVDDRLILDGALQKLKLRTLVLAGADFLDEAAWLAVQDWVKAGGVLVGLQSRPAQTLEGKTALWEAQAPATPPIAASGLRVELTGELPVAYTINPGVDEGALTGMWHNPEPGARWAAPGAGISLPLAGGKTYRITLTGWVPEWALPQQMTLDGQTIEAVPNTQAAWEWTVITPPSEDLAFHMLRFEGPAWTPSERQQGSPDSRELTVYVGKLDVREAGAPEAELAPFPKVNLFWDTAPLWQQGTVKLGEGLVLTLDATALSERQRAELVKTLCEEAGAQVGHPEWNAPVLDAGVDRVLVSRFEGYLLYFNTAAENLEYPIEYRENDFPEGTARPAHMKQLLRLPARTITVVPLG